MPPRSGPLDAVLVTSASLFMFAVANTQAHAAIRRCAPAVTSVATDKTDEQNARRNAIAAWTNKVRQLGDQFASWRLAIDRSITCDKVKDAGFRCIVTAGPCLIQQNPSITPPVRKPEPRPKPANSISL